MDTFVRLVTANRNIMQPHGISTALHYNLSHKWLISALVLPQSHIYWLHIVLKVRANAITAFMQLFHAYVNSQFTTTRR